MRQVGGNVQLIDQPVALRRVQFLRRRQELLLKGLLSTVTNHSSYQLKEISLTRWIFL